MADAAYYNSAMLEFDVVAGYIGGPAAAHTWADSDWQAVGSKPKLPIWVPAASATYTEARSEIITILDLILHYRISSQQVIAFDLETSTVDLTYISAMASWLRFDADWTGSPHLTAGMMATQWESGTTYDSSLVSQDLYDCLTWR